MIAFDPRPWWARITGNHANCEGLKMQMQDMLFNLRVRDELDANWLTVDDCDQCKLDLAITRELVAGSSAHDAALNVAIVFEAR
jgi:hypothetical protein